MADLMPSMARLEWYLNTNEHDHIEQMDSSARRVEINPFSAVVSYWINGRDDVRWYVSIAGFQVRRDGAQTRTHRLVSFWPEHDNADSRIENAPEWVQAIVATSHDLIGARLMEAAVTR